MCQSECNVQPTVQQGAYFDLGEAFKTESRYGRDAAVDEVDILRDNTPSANAKGGNPVTVAPSPYISVELIIFK